MKTNQTFDQMMIEFDASIDNIIEVARATTLLTTLRADSPAPTSTATSPASVAAPITPSSTKSLPSVSSKSRNMKRALLAKPARKRLTLRASQEELDARLASDNNKVRNKARDVIKRRLYRENKRKERAAGNPIALCEFTQERVQEALKPCNCSNSQVPQHILDEIETARVIITTNGPDHPDYPISCGRMYAIKDVLDAKTAVLAVKPSELIAARIATLRSKIIYNDAVITTAKQLGLKANGSD